MSDESCNRDNFFPLFLKEINLLGQLVQLGWAGIALGYIGGSLKRVGGEGEQESDALASEVAAALEGFAKEQAADGFPLLYEVATVRLLSIMDAMVTDFVRRRLSVGSTSWLKEAVKKLEGPLVEFGSASEEEQAQILFELLQHDLKPKLKTGVGRFEALLNAIGYGGPVPDGVCRAILELSETRNVIVHRLGLADSRFIKQCPWLNLNIGDRVRVRQGEFVRYKRACSWYAMELAMRAQQAGETEILGSREEQQEAQSRMIEGV